VTVLPTIIVDRPESRMRARAFKLLYIIAIAVAMMGWLWLLFEAVAKAID
jgi:hypothetical protein